MGGKMIFTDFFFRFYTFTSKRNFFFLPKFYIYNGLDDLFRILSVHIYPLRQNFFVVNKFSYLQPFKEIMRGQDSVTNKQTNKQTPQTIIIVRQDSSRILGLISNINSSNKTNTVSKMNKISHHLKMNCFFSSFFSFILSK